MVRTSDIKQRLLARVSEDSGCWVWQGARNNHGYGLMSLSNFNGASGKKTYYVHRMAYLCFNGDLPDGQLVCHTCDNPLCINPEHLFLGSCQDNMDDMVKKGRKVVNSEVHYGNNYAGKGVLADHKHYKSYSEAGRALGVSDNSIRKRVRKGVEGYKEITLE